MNPDIETLLHQDPISVQAIGDLLLSSPPASEALRRAVATVQDREEKAYRNRGSEQRTPSDHASARALCAVLANGLPAERDEDRAWLWNRKGEVGLLVSDARAAVDSFEKARKTALSTKINADLAYIGATLSQADALRRLLEKKPAEALYRVVLSYAFYTLEDPSHEQEFRDMYTRAGLGLIDCLRGEKQALSDLHFFPGADPRLLQALEKATKGAK